MSFNKLDLPAISDTELTPLVQALLRIIERQAEQIDALKEEVAKLKGHKGRPKIAPSRLNEKKKDTAEGKRPGSDKRSKKVSVEIHETIRIKPTKIPSGSRYLGVREYDVQDLIIKAHNIRYQIEEWLTPEGTCLSGELPEAGRRGHFGRDFVSFIMYQHHHCQVTQPLLLEQIREFGIDISAGQLSNFLTEDQDEFHAEKDDILKAGLEVSSYIQVDDTGARHDGKNGYCTYIGNEQFAWYGSTRSKSRVNFLELLQAGNIIYRLSDAAFRYMALEKLNKAIVKKLKHCTRRVFKSKIQWLEHLEQLGINRTRHIKVVTEASLYGALLSAGFSSDLIILSDDAGQFKIPLLPHALCWIHAERTIKRLVPITDEQREAQAEIEDEFWRFYQKLKDYREKPLKRIKQQIERDFDALFQRRTDFESLNLALKRIRANRSELLLVLDHPALPLHNNTAESDIREYVKRRKVSGSTRSGDGQRCRDTFTTLKKTCRKLGLSFWLYLRDRLAQTGEIAYLPDLIRKATISPSQSVAA